jgi:putative aldouronate transport system substrate-binding protein
MFKRVLACTLMVLLAAVVPVSSLAAGGGLEPVILTYMAVNGRETARTEAILAEVNKVLEEKLNLTLAVATVEQDAYQINLTGLDGIDIIRAADYLSYYDNARQGAYAEITREDIQKYMPQWYADNADKLPSATVDGKIYCIPDANPSWNAPCGVLRKDWFPPDLDEVKSLDDLDKYFAYVLETQPGIMPFAMDTGAFSWINGAFAFAATNLMAPGGPNCTSVVCFNKLDDPNYKLLPTWKQPQLVPFFERMKEFADKGYWTADVMNNPVPLSEAFPGGQTGMRWILRIQGLNHVKQELEQLSPGGELYIYEFGLENNVPIDTVSPMGGAIAIPRTGKNMERALMFCELIYTDPSVYYLFRYGIEGEDYTLNENGEVVIADVEAGFGYGEPYNNTNFDLIPEGGNWEGYEALKEQVKAREQQNPFVGFGFDSTPVSDIANNLWTVHMEYAVPIYLGLVDDVQAAIDELNRQYDLVGYQEYEDEVFKQLEQFLVDAGFAELGYTITR